MVPVLAVPPFWIAVPGVYKKNKTVTVKSKRPPVLPFLVRLIETGGKHRRENCPIRASYWSTVTILSHCITADALLTQGFMKKRRRRHDAVVSCTG